MAHRVPVICGPTLQALEADDRINPKLRRSPVSPGMHLENPTAGRDRPLGLT